MGCPARGPPHPRPVPEPWYNRPKPSTRSCALPCPLPLITAFPFAGNLDITPDDPRWIGAWWGGFLLCGALLFFSSLLMFGFPQSLPPHADPAMESEQAMLPEREYERPKPSNGVLRHPLEPDSSASCFQQLRGKGASSSAVAGAMGPSRGRGKGSAQDWVPRDWGRIRLVLHGLPCPGLSLPYLIQMSSLA